MSQTVEIQKFKCVNGCEWEDKDTGMCPKCYSTLYDLKNIYDLKQSGDFQDLLKMVLHLKKKYNLDFYHINGAIEEEL